MKSLFPSALLSALLGGSIIMSASAHAGEGPDAASCAAAAGSFLSGVVVQGPRFARGHEQRGVELSHTRLSLRSDADGALYDVAMDNVFAAGSDAAGRQVPAPLSSIRPGDHLALCGQPYDDGSRGLHWVHSNCGARPTPRAPDGWVRKIDATGRVGDNLEGSQEYCGLWGHRR